MPPISILKDVFNPELSKPGRAKRALRTLYQVALLQVLGLFIVIIALLIMWTR